jgi:hypothetical protein
MVPLIAPRIDRPLPSRSSTDGPAARGHIARSADHASKGFDGCVGAPIPKVDEARIRLEAIKGLVVRPPLAFGTVADVPRNGRRLRPGQRKSDDGAIVDLAELQHESRYVPTHVIGAQVHKLVRSRSMRSPTRQAARDKPDRSRRRPSTPYRAHPAQRITSILECPPNGLQVPVPIDDELLHGREAAGLNGRSHRIDESTRALPHGVQWSQCSQAPSQQLQELSGREYLARSEPNTCRNHKVVVLHRRGAGKRSR